MSQKRMFSKRITDKPSFTKMPPTSQLLYFHLGMHADDDGIVEAYNVLRLTGIQDDDLRILVAKGFVKVLNEDMVTYILDWNEHNKIRADRKVDSIYKDLLIKLLPGTKPKKKKPRADTGKETSSHRMDGQWTDNGQHRLNKDSISKDKLGKDSNGKQIIDIYTDLLKQNNIFYIPADYEYSNFHNGYKKYIKDVAHDDIEKAMYKWFENKLGSWCGYKLANFWGDFGKIQVIQNNQNYKKNALEEASKKARENIIKEYGEIK